MEWLLLALALLLILGTGVFVAGEFSLLTLDKHTVEQAVARGERGSRYIERGMHHLSTQLSAAQVGITITTLLTGYLMEPSLGRILAPVLELLPVPVALADGVALAAALLVSTVLSMVIGELVPKNLAIAAPLAAARIAVPIQYVFSLAFKPVIAVLNGTANKVLEAMGIEPQEESTAGRSADELTALVRHSAEEGTMDEQTADLLTRTLAFSERTAEDVMSPRTRMSTVRKSTTAAEIMELARETGFSRFPVVGDSRDEILGVVHVKQAFAVPLPNRGDAFAGGLMTDVSEVPETLPLDPLLRVLRERGNQMAVVVDEYGGTAGVVTLEDVVEELVGEVADEHDRMRVSVRPARDGSWIVPGRLRPDEVEAVTGIEIPEDPDYETVAGCVLLALGRIPVVGERVRLDDAELVVERMHGHRIERLRLIPDYADYPAQPGGAGERHE
ncbi:hemolysin family protein [Brevibacterium sp. BRM-1]|uniref:hemolysin family protein n=1 Tax=Brevibacterium sp. BRM-1 TaxID=2999062 RepID=UPI00227FFD30|nr:hemolysin family protein [Brevibacterium sp. BRM-1]WAL40519.1 hemolysin family protein [Brevibacterium sp. BRM-1]